MHALRKHVFHTRIPQAPKPLTSFITVTAFGETITLISHIVQYEQGLIRTSQEPTQRTVLTLLQNDEAFLLRTDHQRDSWPLKRRETFTFVRICGPPRWLDSWECMWKEGEQAVCWLDNEEEAEKGMISCVSPESHRGSSPLLSLSWGSYIL